MKIERIIRIRMEEIIWIRKMFGEVMGIGEIMRGRKEKRDRKMRGSKIGIWMIMLFRMGENLVIGIF